MVALVARGKKDDRPALILMLGDADVRRLYELDAPPLSVDAAHYVPDWPNSWCFIAGGTPERDRIMAYCEQRGIENALMLGLNDDAIAQLKAGDLVPFDITLFGAPDGWRGDVVLGYGATAHDVLERFAKHFGPDTTILRSEGDF